MSVREILNKYRGVTVAVSIVVIVAVLAFLLWPSSEGVGTFASTNFYTDDDGETYFIDNAMQVYPFDRNGKQAVRAHVFECNGERKVHYLERMTESGRRSAEQSLAASGGKDMSASASENESAFEYKRPGESEWTSKPPGPLPCDGGPAIPVSPSS